MIMIDSISIADEEAINNLESKFSDELSNNSTKKSNYSSSSKNTNYTKDTKDTKDNEDDIIITINEFNSNEVSRYKTLDKYFKKLNADKKQFMVDIINKNSEVSLRILDKFVTKYCSKLNTTYILNNNDDNDEFNVHISYKAQLKSYRKSFFDPFRRGKKFYYNYDKLNSDKKTLTTLGQLNFFKWAFSNKIIDYVSENRYNIVKTISKWDKEGNKKNCKKMIKKKKEIKNNKKPIIEKVIPNNKEIVVTFD